MYSCVVEIFTAPHLGYTTQPLRYPPCTAPPAPSHANASTIIALFMVKKGNVHHGRIRKTSIFMNNRKLPSPCSSSSYLSLSLYCLLLLPPHPSSSKKFVGIWYHSLYVCTFPLFLPHISLTSQKALYYHPFSSLHSSSEVVSVVVSGSARKRKRFLVRCGVVR